MHWQSNNNTPILFNNQVHIWRTQLNQNAHQVSELTKLLNPKERDRAERFKIDRAKNNFIIARGALRLLLAKYMDIKPKEIIFEQNSYGKPLLNSDLIKFNISHANDYALFIFAKNYYVGVDVEHIRNDFDFMAIAQKFFSAQEVIHLSNIPQAQQLQAFFSCWSRKEAFIKGIGKGIFFALDKFTVEVCNKTSGKLKLDIAKEKLPELQHLNWSLEALNPGNNHVGAFAVSGEDYEVSYYDIPMNFVL